jgi:hypothetical protein
MLSALLMFHRAVKAVRYALREEAFANVLGAGVFLVGLGTLVFTLHGWDPVDSLYFSVSTLTTTSVADPDLVLTDAWTKLFTVFYQLLGIGILVEVVRRLAVAFIAVRAEEKEAKASPSSAGTPS